MRFATLPDHLDCGTERAIEHAAAIGLDGIELLVPEGIHDVGPHGMRLTEGETAPTADELFSSSYREGLVEFADERGVALPSICPSFLNFRPGLTAADRSERRSVAEILERLVGIAEDVGARVILVPFFRAASIDGNLDRVARAIHPATITAEDAGVTLALETDLPAVENRSLLETIDSNAAGIYYDVGNATRYGYDPAAEIRTLGDDVTQVHFKDVNEGSGHVPLGGGQVDFDGVVEALAAVGYDDWIVFETSYDEHPVDALSTNLEFARSLVARHAD